MFNTNLIDQCSLFEGITLEDIAEKLQYNLLTDDPEATYDCPADVLNNILSLKSYNYTKNANLHVNPMVEKINFDWMIEQSRAQCKINQFQRLIEELEEFVTTVVC